MSPFRNLFLSKNLRAWEGRLNNFLYAKRCKSLLVILTTQSRGITLFPESRQNLTVIDCFLKLIVFLNTKLNFLVKKSYLKKNKIYLLAVSLFFNLPPFFVNVEIGAFSKEPEILKKI